jgi:hypothetical protein
MRRIIPMLLTLSLLLSACSLTGKSRDVYAWNHVQALDSGGVTIEIARVLFAKQGVFDDEFLKAPYFQDKPVIGELIFLIKNNTAQSMNVYPDQGHVVVDGEQVNLFDVALLGAGGDPLGGEILPAVTKIGHLWFGLRRAKFEDLQSMTVVIVGPHDNYLDSMGGDYRFQVDLSDHKNEPLPDELKY